MDNIWIVGACSMAQEYIKVLKDLKENFTVIGRGEESARKIELEFNINVKTGGLAYFLKCKPEKTKTAIVAVNVEELYETTLLLLKYGVKRILLEKPGATTKEELVNLKELAEKNNAQIYIAYNRRFYKAAEVANEIIKKDGGVKSFNFEFTEWGHVIENIEMPNSVSEKWFLANSTHVVDLAFYLGGTPREIATFSNGSLSWHKSSSVFAGAGVSENGALFSYQANWGAPGRWSVEVLTCKHRLIFRPMEVLHIQKIGSVAIDKFDADYSLDENYKPGLFNQLAVFLADDTLKLCTIDEQISKIDYYLKIANY
jgi:predicted dehydrogenase